MSSKKDNIWLAGHYILTMLTSLLALKFNLMNFGAELFGVWVLLSSIWGLSNVLDLGFGMALIRAISRGKSKNSDLNVISSTGLVFFLIFGILILAIGFSVSMIYYVGNPSLVNENIKETAVKTSLILGLFFYVNYISTCFRSLFEGLGGFVLYSKIAIIYSFLTLSAALLSLIFDLDFTGLATFLLIAAIIQLVLLKFLLRLVNPDIRTGLFNFNWKIFKELFSFSINVQGATILGTAIDPVLKYIIGTNLNVSYVSYYDIAKRFSLASSGLFSAAFRTIYPKASKLVPEDYRSFLFDACLQLSKKGVIFAGLIFMLASPVFATIFVYFYKSPLSYNIFILLALAESINLVGFSYYTMLLGIGEAKFLTLIQLVTLTGATLFVYSGIIITNSYYGLGGFVIIIAIANGLILKHLKKIVVFSTVNFLVKAGGWKLLFILMALSTVFYLNHSFGLPIFVVSGVLAISWFFLFFGDIKELISMGKSLIKGI